MMNLKSSLCAVALVLAAVTFTKCTAPATADQLHKEEKWAKAVDKLIDDYCMSNYEVSIYDTYSLTQIIRQKRLNDLGI